MKLNSIDIVNVRSIVNLKMNFSSDVNLIYGENGKGKTSILEAIHFLSISKSFRKGKKLGIKTKGKKSMFVSGKIDSNGEKIIISYGNTETKKKFKINKKTINKTKNLIGVFPSVILSPEDVNIVSGGNSTKVFFIDKLLSTTSSDYLNSLLKYKKILVNRNKCLSEKQPERNIFLWDNLLAAEAFFIWEKRILFFKEFKKIFKKNWEKILLKNSHALNYKVPQFSTKEGFVNALKKNIQKDYARKHTTIGPHRDEIFFKFNDFDLRHEASQGEKKFFLILLKISEAEYIYKKLNKRPVLLMDDLFAKLDTERGEKVLKLFKQKYQTFITTTDNSAQAYFNSSVNLIRLDQKDKECFVA